MRCLICGKDYRALGVHIRHKHHVSPEEYKQEFGLLKVTPLAETEIRDALRASQKQRLLDPEYLEQLRQQCASNSAKPSNMKGSMSAAGRAAVAKRDIERNEKYLAECSSKVISSFQVHGTILPVAHELGMSFSAVKRILNTAGFVTDREVTNKRRVANVDKTISARREPKLAALIEALKNSDTAVLARAKSGVSKTTYTRWKKAGLIPEQTK